jgi:hypothetical protein
MSSFLNPITVDTNKVISINIDNSKYDKLDEARQNFLLSASFPKKLYDLVTNCDPNVVTWEEHGKAFRIVDPDRFSNEILPFYFRRKFIYTRRNLYSLMFTNLQTLRSQASSVN